MFKSRPLIRSIITIISFINIVLFPVGRSLTNPDKLNALFDAVNFERIFISVYSKIITEQLPIEIDEASKQNITNSLISEEKLKEQRVENIKNFLVSIENKQIPTIYFDIENPINKIKTDFNDLKKDFGNYIDTLAQNFNCDEENPPAYCKLITNITDKKDSAEESDNMSSDIFKISGSLGINEQNIDNANFIFKFLKYGPEAILLLIALLMIIGYATTLPDLEFSRKLIFTFVTVCIWALVFWGGIPLIFKSSNPIKFAFSQDDYSIQNSVNTGIGDMLANMSKEGILLAVIMTVISALIFLFLLIVVKKEQTIKEITDRKKETESYNKSESIDSEPIEIVNSEEDSDGENPELDDAFEDTNDTEE